MFAPQERGWHIPRFRPLTRADFDRQYARAQAMQEALRKAERAHPRENAPKLGQIRGLGLLGRDDDSKDLMQPKQ